MGCFFRSGCQSRENLASATIVPPSTRCLSDRRRLEYQTRYETENIPRSEKPETLKRKRSKFIEQFRNHQRTHGGRALAPKCAHDAVRFNYMVHSYLPLMFIIRSILSAWLEPMAGKYPIFGSVRDLKIWGAPLLSDTNQIYVQTLQSTSRFGS